MPAPRVSVIVPTYNRATFLPHLLDSLLAQTMRDWEAVVVDDGSGDDTVACVRAYMRRDERVRLFVQPRNGGLPAAINRGLRAARGEYLTYCGDDDLYTPDALERLAAVLDGDAAAGLVGADFEQFYDDGRPPVTVRLQPPPVGYGPVVGPGRLFRRSVVDTIGDFDPAFELVEDLDFFLRAERAGVGLRQVDRVLYRFRLHGSGLTARRWEVQAAAAATLLLHGASTLREHLNVLLVAHARARGLVGVPSRFRRVRIKLAALVRLLPLWWRGRSAFSEVRRSLVLWMWPRAERDGLPPVRCAPWRAPPPPDGPEVFAEPRADGS